MAWRVIQNGAMVEVVNGVQEINGRKVEKTSTFIAAEGQLIERELSSEMVKRYDTNDAYTRSIVERVKVETDDEGNKTVTAIGRAEDDDSHESELQAQLDEAKKRAESAEAAVANASSTSEAHDSLLEENENLRKQVDELTQALDEATAADSGDEGSSLSYSDLSTAALAAEAKARGIAVTRADGEAGKPLESDYVKALEEARAAS